MKTLRTLAFVTIIALIFFSCKKSEEDKGLELSQDIHNIVPDSIINDMTTLGLPIHGGKTPPNFEKIYLASPFVLKASNREGDVPGYVFADYKVKFYDQDNDKLSVKIDYINGPEAGTGLGGFISGNGNSFTAFIKIKSQMYGDSAFLVQVLSGTIVSGGLENFYYANFMLNNYGNPHGYWINNGEGRIIYDSDSISPEQNTFKSLTIKSKDTKFLKSAAMK